MKTQAKHTPGPWYLLEKEMFGFSIRANTPRGSEIIAETGGFDSDANAHLIAAAPELLEALKMVIDETNAGLWKDVLPIRKAREAIRKAEGGN